MAHFISLVSRYITHCRYIYTSAVKFQISNFFWVRFKSLIFGYLEIFDGLKSLF